MGDQGHISHLLSSVSGLLAPFDGPEQIHLSLSCPQRQYSCLGDHQDLSMRFISSCTTSDPERRDPHNPASPQIVQSIRYPESSQRTTSAFPSFAQHFPYHSSPVAFSAPVPSTAPLACNVSLEGSGWISGQDVEEDTLARLDIQSLNYPDIQSSLSTRAQVSPGSATTECTSTDDSDVESGDTMSKMMAHFQAYTPSLDADMLMRMPEQGLPTPSLMTFRLGRRSLRPVTDPDSAKILENFDDFDEDTSEDSCESLSLSSSPLYSPTSFYDGRESGSYGDDIDGTIDGMASHPRRQSYATDGAPSFCKSDRTTYSRRAPCNARPRKSGSSRKSKMHECKTCHKIFPRPSGLKTHMNSHSGAKPFKCPVSSCDKCFAVRSNAKRHLKTHGINPSSLIEGPSQGSSFTVGFEAPLVNHHVHDAGRPPTRYRWIPHSPATRMHPVGDCEWTGTPSVGDESESYTI